MLVHLTPISVKSNVKVKVKVHSHAMKNINFSAIDECYYDMMHFWLFVEFCVLKWPV